MSETYKLISNRIYKGVVEEILTDPDGTISIALGAYGVPETFLVNSKSKIIRKYIGPLKTENILEITKIIK